MVRIHIDTSSQEERAKARVIQQRGQRQRTSSVSSRASSARKPQKAPGRTRSPSSSSSSSPSSSSTPMRRGPDQAIPLPHAPMNASFPQGSAQPSGYPGQTSALNGMPLSAGQGQPLPGNATAAGAATEGKANSNRPRPSLPSRPPKEPKAPPDVQAARTRQTRVLKEKQSREMKNQLEPAPRQVDAGSGWWPPLAPVL